MQKTFYKVNFQNKIVKVIEDKQHTHDYLDLFSSGLSCPATHEGSSFANPLLFFP